MQLSRLKELYSDLRTTILPLLPENHPILVTLSLPLPPTSFPLRSALGTLREILNALRTRCAPVHDQSIDALIALLDDPPEVALPTIVVNVTRGIWQLSEQMKEDLAQFVLGTMGEDQLHAAIVQEAAAREKEFIHRLCGPSQVRESWQNWLAELAIPGGQGQPTPGSLTIKERFIRRLTQALAANCPVTCDLFISTESSTSDSAAEARSHEGGSTQSTLFNALPPPLLFVTPTLLYIQNYLQALVIAASLRALIRLPHPSTVQTSSNDGLPERDFEERVWLLLKADIDGEPSADGTKLVNLADEVVRVSRLSNGGKLDSAEESRLRAAVDRTLQPNDAVFILLQKRLMQSIQSRLTGSASAPERQGMPTAGAPRYIQSGRDIPGTRRLLRNMVSHHDTTAGEEETQKLVIKGFDHPVIVVALSEVLSMLQGCIDWTERVWEDLMVLSIP